ncbi:N-carbamoyl-D-amino acid hydrolase [Novipirellula aureliae]|uniref:N-carbamoyl-D-amino acid hydrolase n=1 Tax=Novipirellula aureliae TaxID=2527966 RepID=A0A5C6EA56_9BACT|nr:carbon-nitrogen hydrolase family protein [Novipirellula aureliae]TWU45738.1 N-carbamoyl-D-amino acid hydrolase [Novipirellula aureliae]
MLIACVQTDIAFADFDENKKRVFRAIEEAGKQNADLVVMPECMLCGYAYESRRSALEQAITDENDAFKQIAEAAQKANLHITLGFLEKQGDQLFNASVLVGASGVVGKYRKIHLPHLGVDRFVDRGDIPYTVYQADDVRIGMAICYDSSFPEPMRVLGLAGADVIALGTNWPVTAMRTAEVVPPARSMENHLFFVAANRIGSEGGFDFCGLSTICGPDGVVLARSDNDRPVILYADIDPEEARNKTIERTAGTHVIDRFKDRRPEFYGPIGK